MGKIIAAVFFALGLMPAMANPAFDLGPAIGTQAPSLGQPLDAAGKPRTLDSLMGEKGLVLFFVRSASWCPYCKAQIIDLNSGLGEIGSGAIACPASPTTSPRCWRELPQNTRSNTRCSAIRNRR